MNTPVWKMEPWREQIFSNGYLAAMNGEPLNPFAMDEWLRGYALFLEQNVSAPIRKLMPVSS